MGWDTNPLQVSPLTVCHLYPNVSSVIYSCAALVSQSWSGFKSWQAWFFSQLHKLCLNLWWSTLHAILILLQQPLCLLTKMTLYPGQLSVKYILHSRADSGETCSLIFSVLYFSVLYWLLLHIHKAINLKTKPDALLRLTQCAILLPLGS